MRLMKAVCCAAAIVAFSAPGARADEWNKKTILTFSGPVQIPGVTLAPGTYVFKLADLASNRHVVQVFDKDEKRIYATILAIPDQKLDPSDKPVVLFAERPAGVPQAVKAWFYPGETIGNEFVYPKDQAMKIARDTHQSVLSMEDTSTATTTEAERMDSMKTAKLSRVDDSGATPASPTTTTTATTTTTTTTTAKQAPAPTVTAPATSTMSTDSQLKNSSGNAQVTPVATGGEKPAPRRLPRTAGTLPLFELLSGLALAGGYGVRRLRARLSTR